MSTEEKRSPFDGKKYLVGVWKRVDNTKINEEKVDISTISLFVPTYGSWAGEKGVKSLLGS